MVSVLVARPRALVTVQRDVGAAFTGDAAADDAGRGVKREAGRQARARISVALRRSPES
jgi:hypothetical protein